MERAGTDDLVVLGGRQRAPSGVREIGDGWYGYDAGVVVQIRGGVPSLVSTYRSAPGTCGPDDPVLFKSATVGHDRIHACTQTEILDLVGPDLEVQRHVSLPCFNDVHHVVPTATGTRLVAVSGTESVVEVADDGTVIEAWHTLGEDPWPLIESERELRTGVDLKPHRSHPNHLFTVGEARWVTRFEQRDAVCLGDPGQRIAVDHERIHDGVVRDGLVHFTTVDGHIAVGDPTGAAPTRLIRLDDGLADGESLGWVRGLWLGDDHAWVGFSRIRFTRARARLSWLRTGLRSRPTRVARYSLPDWRLEAEVDLEPVGCNAVFTVAPWPAGISRRDG